MTYIVPLGGFSNTKNTLEKQNHYAPNRADFDGVPRSPLLPNVATVSRFNNPVEVVHWRQGKYLERGAFGTLYFRMLTNKVNFNFGIITGEKGEVLTIWNGYPQNISLTRIAYDNLDGVEIVPLDGILPILLTPYRSKRLQIRLSSQGSATLNGFVTLFFSNGDKIKFRITGSRMVLLNIPPNWKDEYKETFEYRTNILTSYNQREQRRNLLSLPRKTVSFTGVAKGELVKQIHNKIYGWQTRTFMLPLWYQGVRLLESVEAGQQSIRIDVKKFDFVVGGNICVWGNFNHNEIFEIVKIENGRLYLNVPFNSNFPSGTKVYPAETMRVNRDVNISQITSDTAEFSFELIADIANMFKLPNYAPDAQYNGVEVLERKPNWERGIDDEYSSVIDKVDFGFGLNDWFERNAPNLTMRRLNFVAKDYDDILWWKAFIQRQKGSFKSFYVPSWLCDCAIVADYVAGAQFIDVRDDNLTTMLAHLKERSRLRLQTHKKVYYVTVVAIDGINGIARLELETPIQERISQNEFAKISFMQRCRLASDIVSVNFVTNSVAEITLNVKQIREN